MDLLVVSGEEVAMNERGVDLGDERHLVGILTEPESVGTGGEGETWPGEGTMSAAPG